MATMSLLKSEKTLKYVVQTYSHNTIRFSIFLNNLSKINPYSLKVKTVQVYYFSYISNNSDTSLHQSAIVVLGIPPVISEISDKLFSSINLNLATSE